MTERIVENLKNVGCGLAVLAGLTVTVLTVTFAGRWIADRAMEKSGMAFFIIVGLVAFGWLVGMLFRGRADQ